MYRVTDKQTGKTIDFDDATFEAKCPDCGNWHKIDLTDTVITVGKDFTFKDTRVSCHGCTNKKLKDMQ